MSVTVCVLDAGFSSRAVYQRWTDDPVLLDNDAYSMDGESLKDVVLELHQIHGKASARDMFTDVEETVGLDSPLISGDVTVGDLPFKVWIADTGEGLAYVCGPACPDDAAILTPCGMSIWRRLERDGTETETSCEVYVEG